MMLIVAIEDGDKWNQFSFKYSITGQYDYTDYGSFSQMAVMSLLLTGECSFVSKKENTSSSFISTLKS